MELDAAFAVNLDGERRIGGLNTGNELRHLYLSADDEAFGSNWGFFFMGSFGRRSDPVIATDDSLPGRSSSNEIHDPVIEVAGRVWIARNDVYRNGSWRANAAGRGRMSRVMRRCGMLDFTRRTIRRNRGDILNRDAFTFAEQRKKDKRSKGEGLQGDGNGYGALLDAAGALFGLRVAFDEAPAE